MFAQGALSFKKSGVANSRDRSFQAGGTEKMQARRRSLFLSRLKSGRAHQRQHRQILKNNNNDNKSSTLDRDEQTLQQVHNDAVAFVCRFDRCFDCIPNDVAALHKIVMSGKLSERTAYYLVASGLVCKIMHFLDTPDIANAEALQPAQQVVDILIKLGGCNSFILQNLDYLGAVDCVLNCLEWSRCDEKLCCKCLDFIAILCIHAETAQNAIQNGVIEVIIDLCEFASEKVIVAVVDTLRSLVKIADASQWKELKAVPQFVACILKRCKSLKLDAKLQMQSGEDGMELDGKEPDKLEKNALDPEHLEQEIIWMLCETMELEQNGLLLHLAGISMPIEPDEKEQKQQQQQQSNQTTQLNQPKQQQTQKLMQYLHTLMKEEAANYSTQQEWHGLEVCTPILALWDIFAANESDVIRREILQPDAFDLMRFFIFEMPQLRQFTLRMVCNIIMQGGDGSEPFCREDAELIDAALKWAQIGNGGIGGMGGHSNKKLYENRTESCRFVTVYIKYVVKDVGAFILSSSVLKLIQTYLESKFEFELWFGVTALLEALKRIEKDENNVLESVLNVLEVNKIVGNVNDVAARVADGSYGEMTVNAVNELCDKYFDEDAHNFATKLCIF